jgi:hypothetical protein
MPTSIRVAHHPERYALISNGQFIAVATKMKRLRDAQSLDGNSNPHPTYLELIERYLTTFMRRLRRGGVLIERWDVTDQGFRVLLQKSSMRQLLEVSISSQQCSKLIEMESRKSSSA